MLLRHYNTRMTGFDLPRAVKKLIQKNRARIRSTLRSSGRGRDESRPYYMGYLTIIFIVSVIVSPEALRPLRRAMYMPCGSERSI